MKTRIILVGGFLGAGKTTLLWETAHKLTDAGLQTGLITNDQASELVDTAFLKRANGIVSEVSGSCFCCNFNGFTKAISDIRAQRQVDVIIAEPVGSCTDLSATIFQPLKDKFGDELVIAPLSVLVDPSRLSDILDGGDSGLHARAAYIVRKQLEEADIIVISKTNLMTSDKVEELKTRAAKEWSHAEVLAVSSKSGEGIQDWLNQAMNRLDSGNQMAEVDYDIYAEGEAVLGWLNTTVKLESEDADWDTFAKNLLVSLNQCFAKMGVSVGHVKLLVESDGRYIMANDTGKNSSLSFRGTAGNCKEAVLTLNARAEMEPDALEALIMEEIIRVCKDKIHSSIAALKCLKPGRPNPTYRYGYVVEKNS